MSRPFRVVTHKEWLARHFASVGAVRDWGFDIDPDTAMDTIWWAPGAWVASAFKAGVHLPLLSCGPRWLDRLPYEFTKRAVVTAELQSIRHWAFKPEVFLKLPEAKLDDCPAKVYRTTHMADTLRQFNHYPPETLVQVQDPVEFTIEARFWVAHGEIVAESPYRIGSMIWGYEKFDYVADQLMAKSVYRRMRDFAREVVVWGDGPPGYVLDIGWTRQEGPLVVEANAAWSSGPYNADPEGIFKAIEASHDFEGKYSLWAWRHNPVYDNVQPLKTPLGAPCFNCGRRDRDKTKEKCYLC